MRIVLFDRSVAAFCVRFQSSRQALLTYPTWLDFQGYLVIFGTLPHGGIHVTRHVRFLSMSNGSRDQPGVAPPPETRGYRFNHTMLRVKDPRLSLEFYSRVLGMSLLRRLEFPEMRFTLYFLGFPVEGQEPPAAEESRTEWLFGATGILELTHNWGTESQPEFSYHSGNSQPQGFGHICISVPDLASAERRFDRFRVPFVKRSLEGKMKHVTFVKDPDGYWIEIVQPNLLRTLGINVQNA